MLFTLLLTNGPSVQKKSLDERNAWDFFGFTKPISSAVNGFSGFKSYADLL